MPSLETFTCPVTRLPIRQHSEWQKIKPGAGFELSIELLGEQIIVSHSAGMPNRQSIIPALDLMTEIIEQYFPDRHYVQIFDYRKIGINHLIEARRIVIEKLKERRLMLGAIFYGVNSMIRASIQIARFFHQLPFPLLIAENYPEATGMALDLLDGNRREAGAREEGEKFDRQTAELITRLSVFADPNRDRSRNREILARLDEIIRRRDQRARSCRQRKNPDPSGNPTPPTEKNNA